MLVAELKLYRKWDTWNHCMWCSQAGLLQISWSFSCRLISFWCLGFLRISWYIVYQLWIKLPWEVLEHFRCGSSDVLVSDCGGEVHMYKNCAEKQTNGKWQSRHLFSFSFKPNSQHSYSLIKKTNQNNPQNNRTLDRLPARECIKISGTKKLKRNMLWKGNNIFEIMSLALFTNMHLYCGFKCLASQFFKWWANKRWRWWCVNLVMSVFKAKKLTWQGKLKACLDSEIKYCIHTMLYIWVGRAKIGLKMFEADITQAEDLWLCFPPWDYLRLCCPLRY